MWAGKTKEKFSQILDSGRVRRIFAYAIHQTLVYLLGIGRFPDDQVRSGHIFESLADLW